MMVTLSKKIINPIDGVEKVMIRAADPEQDMDHNFQFDDFLEEDVMEGIIKRKLSEWGYNHLDKFIWN